VLQQSCPVDVALRSDSSLQDPNMEFIRWESVLPTDAHYRYCRKREKDHLHKLDIKIKSEQLILSKIYPINVVIKN
jgi:hypothetical protein